MPDYCLHCCLEHSRCTCDDATKAQPVKNPPSRLPAGTLLAGRYLVGRLSSTSREFFIVDFDVTYLAVDLELGLRVVITEYMPSSGVVSSANGHTVVVKAPQYKELFDFGLREFFEEARLLARISKKDNPGIASILNVFEANGTGYYVMRYSEGRTLSKMLESRGGTLPEKEAISIVTATLEALREVHEAGLFHGNINPENILIRDDGGVTLINFAGALLAYAKELMRVDERTGIIIRYGTRLFCAYEAPECRSEEDNQGPWTDFHSVGVTLCRMLAGQRVIHDSRMWRIHKATGGKTSKYLDAVAHKATNRSVSERYQSVAEFQKALIPELVSVQTKDYESNDQRTDQYKKHSSGVASGADPGSLDGTFLGYSVFLWAGALALIAIALLRGC